MKFVIDSNLPPRDKHLADAIVREFKRLEPFWRFAVGSLEFHAHDWPRVRMTLCRQDDCKLHQRRCNMMLTLDRRELMHSMHSFSSERVAQDLRNTVMRFNDQEGE